MELVKLGDEDMGCNFHNICSVLMNFCPCHPHTLDPNVYNLPPQLPFCIRPAFSPLMFPLILQLLQPLLIPLSSPDLR